MAARIDDDIESIPADHHQTLSKFLAFLATDIDSHSKRSKVMDVAQQAQIQLLTSSIKVGLKEPPVDDCQ